MQSVTVVLSLLLPSSALRKVGLAQPWKTLPAGQKSASDHSIAPLAAGRGSPKPFFAI